MGCFKRLSAQEYIGRAAETSHNWSWLPFDTFPLQRVRSYASYCVRFFSESTVPAAVMNNRRKPGNIGGPLFDDRIKSKASLPAFASSRASLRVLRCLLYSWCPFPRSLFPSGKTLVSDKLAKRLATLCGLSANRYLQSPIADKEGISSVLLDIQYLQAFYIEG